MLEDAVAEAVPAFVPRAAASGQRSGRPEGARLLVPDVERLPAAVADRVVVEGGQAELVSVLHPRVGAPALADDRPHVGTRDHVRPRRGRALPGLQADDVLAAVEREAAEAVVKDAVSLGQCLDRFRRRLARGLERCRQALGRHAALHLLGECLDGVGEHHAGDSLEQHPILFGQLFRAPDEHAAGLVDDGRFGPRVDQAHDLVVKDGPVAREVLVQDHQVCRQALDPPVGVGLQRLLHEVDATHVTDAHQDDGQIARYAEAPEPGWPS